MKYLDLFQKDLADDEQVHVWYKEEWCGSFDAGIIPTQYEVTDLVYNYDGQYLYEDIYSFRNNKYLSYEVKKTNA